MTDRKYRSDAFAAVHETAEALYEVGAVDKQTMREFDEACLTPVRVSQSDEIRGSAHAGAPFPSRCSPRYLNVSKNLVSDWERGVKKPGGPALRLLTILEARGLRAIA